ncbi:NAD(P)-dependent alcohol dehydrogenase [Aeromicrobium sp. Sec7.5]|uniref:NAD(P)-dependent alcohol dehydrogenase n=1 Tax=Aeromicrobium sp. Sec7.5 TaxID=3121276 RepID=UPI002FE441B1
MRAVQYRTVGAGPAVVDVPRPEVGPGQVLLDVLAAGLCHFDVSVMAWPADAFPYALPMTLGHECAGRVAATGAGVSAVAVGDLVAVYGPWGCGTCEACSQGRENYCTRAVSLGIRPPGLGRDGALAEQMLVDDERHLVPLEGLDPVQAVPLTDAGLTPYHAVKAALPVLTPGATVVVIGVGGLGHVAVQLLRALTSVRVVAIDVDAKRLDGARTAGAEEVLLADDRTAERVRDLNDGQGVRAVFDFVGSQSTLDLAAAVAGAEAHVSIVGVGGGSLPVSFRTMPFGATVRCSYWGTRHELVEVMALARSGAIVVEHELISLEDVPEAYERLRVGRVHGRAVAVPGAGDLARTGGLNR